MTKKLYFGNLDFGVTDESLSSEVSKYAPVISATVISDRETGRSRGFGFVEVDDPDAAKVISAMSGLEWNGRALTVSEAREREDRRGGGGGFRR